MEIILLTSKTCHFIDVEKELNVLGALASGRAGFHRRIITYV